MIKLHDIFNKQGSTRQKQYSRTTDAVYIIGNGYATFEGLILITSWKSALILTPC